MQCFNSALTVTLSLSSWKCMSAQSTFYHTHKEQIMQVEEEFLSWSWPLNSQFRPYVFLNMSDFHDYSIQLNLLNTSFKDFIWYELYVIWYLYDLYEIWVYGHPYGQPNKEVANCLFELLNANSFMLACIPAAVHWEFCKERTWKWEMVFACFSVWVYEFMVPTLHGGMWMAMK